MKKAAATSPSLTCAPLTFLRTARLLLRLERKTSARRRIALFLTAHSPFRLSRNLGFGNRYRGEALRSSSSWSPHQNGGAICRNGLRAPPSPSREHQRSKAAASVPDNRC